MFYDSKLILHDCYKCQPAPVYMIEGTSAMLCKRIGQALHNKYDPINSDSVYQYSFMDFISGPYPYSHKDEIDPVRPYVNPIDKVVHRSATATSKILDIANQLAYDGLDRVILDTNFFRCIIDALAIGTDNIEWIFSLNKYPLCAIIPTAIFYVTGDHHNDDSDIMEKIRGWYAAYIAEMKSHTNVIYINADNPDDQILEEIDHEINRIEGRYKNE